MNFKPILIFDILYDGVVMHIWYKDKCVGICRHTIDVINVGFIFWCDK